jgi:hypothetical protein
MQPTGMQPNGFSPAGGCLSAPRASVISKGVFGKSVTGPVTVKDADDGDTTTMQETLITAAEHLEAVLPEGDILRELVTDKGFHSNDRLGSGGSGRQSPASTRRGNPACCAPTVRNRSGPPTAS